MMYGEDALPRCWQTTAWDAADAAAFGPRAPACSNAQTSSLAWQVRSSRKVLQLTIRAHIPDWLPHDPSVSCYGRKLVAK